MVTKEIKEKLIIYLHTANDLPPPFVVVMEDQVVEISQLPDTSQNLSMLAENKEVLVLVPAEDIVLTQVQLPKMNRSRLLKALPFALEDQLIAEIDTLHFATGAYQAGGHLPVAIVSHQKMQSWLAQLQILKVKPDQFIPVTFALPHVDSAWSGAISEMAMVRTGLFEGFACDKSNLSEYLKLAFSTAHPSPISLHLDYYSNDSFISSEAMPVLFQESKKPPEAMMLHFSKALRSPWLNLLQGQYAVKKPKLSIHKAWKMLTYLSATWLGLLFLYPVISYFILHHRVRYLESEIQQIYKRHFKEANVIAHKIRMQEEWQKLNGEMNKNRLLLFMGLIGKDLLTSPNVKLKRFDFQNDQFTLELTATTSDDLASFSDFLTQQGLRVKQQSADLAGARVNAVLLIQ